MQQNTWNRQQCRITSSRALEEKAFVCENNLQQLLGLLENVSQGAEVCDLQVVWKEGWEMWFVLSVRRILGGVQLLKDCKASVLEFDAQMLPQQEPCRAVPS